MARDAELDRLKTAQDLAFQRKQSAYQAQDAAWQRRSQAREVLNHAHEEKQRTYAAQNTSWQDFERVRSHNGPRIDSLNSQQETAFQNMKRAFEDASSAHDRRDGQRHAVMRIKVMATKRKPRVILSSDGALSRKSAMPVIGTMQPSQPLNELRKASRRLSENSTRQKLITNVHRQHLNMPKLILIKPLRHLSGG